MRGVLAAVLLASTHAKYPLLHFDAHEEMRAKLPPAATHAVDAGLPADFTWRDVAGHGALLAPSMNQHVPQYCGGCFLFASAHVIMDRVKIARAIARERGQPSAFRGPDLVVAVQVALNCGGEDFGWGVAGSCKAGGSAPSVYRWVQKFGGLPSEGCFPYLAQDGLGCRPDTICRNCMPLGAGEEDDDGSTGCWAVPGDRTDAPPCAGGYTCATSPYPRITVGDFGALPSADDVGPEEAARAMQLEIARGGPITCNIDAMNLLDYTGEGLATFSPPAGRNANDTDHVVEVVGWGTDAEGVDFWEIRNSWGEYYGDDGFFKIRRGVNDALIETGCTWVHPGGWGVPGTNKWQTFELGEHDEAVAALVARHHATRPWSLEPAGSSSWPWTRGRFLTFGVAVLGLGALMAAFVQPVMKTMSGSQRGASDVSAGDREMPDVAGAYQSA